MLTVLKWLCTSLTAIGCSLGITICVYFTLYAREVLMPYNTVTMIMMAVVLAFTLCMIALLVDMMTDDYWHKVNRSQRE